MQIYSFHPKHSLLELKKKTRLKVAVAYKTVFLYDPLYDSSIRD